MHSSSFYKGKKVRHREIRCLAWTKALTTDWRVNSQALWFAVELPSLTACSRVQDEQGWGWLREDPSSLVLHHHSRRQDWRRVAHLLSMPSASLSLPVPMWMEVKMSRKPSSMLILMWHRYPLGDSGLSYPPEKQVQAPKGRGNECTLPLASWKVGYDDKTVIGIIKISIVYL